MMVDRHASTLMIIDPRKYQEFTVMDYFNAGVHDDRLHVNGSVVRFASVFSWRFFFVFGERSPSLTYFMRVIVFRGRSPS